MYSTFAVLLAASTRSVPTRPPTYAANVECVGTYDKPSLLSYVEPGPTTRVQTFRDDAQRLFPLPGVEPWSARTGAAVLPSQLGAALDGGLSSVNQDFAASYIWQLIACSWIGILCVLAMVVCFGVCCVDRACAEWCGVGRFACCGTTCASTHCVHTHRGVRLGQTPIVVPCVSWREKACGKEEGEEEEEQPAPVSASRRSFAGLVCCWFCPSHLRPEREWPLLPGVHTYNRFSSRFAVEGELQGESCDFCPAAPIPICALAPCCCCVFPIVRLQQRCSGNDDGGDDEESEKEPPTTIKLLTLGSQLVVVALLVGCCVAAIGFSIWGYVQILSLIAGFTGATQEVACVVEDSITWFEALLQPVFNISTLAQGVIGAGFDAVAGGQELLRNFTAIAESLGGLGANLTCGEGGSPDLAQIVANFDALQSAVATESSSSIGALDESLTVVRSAMASSRALLANATDAASTYTNTILDALKGPGRSGSLLMQGYIDQTNTMSTTFANVLFWPTLAVVIGMLTSAAGLLTCTSLYRCIDRRSRYRRCDGAASESDENVLGSTVGGNGDVRTSSLSAGMSLNKEVCCDCAQCVGVWGLHISTLVSWALAVACFVGTIAMLPAAVVISDGCVVGQNAVENMPRWVNESVKTPLTITQQLAVDALDSCLRRESILSALNIDDQLSMLDQLNFSFAESFDPSVLTFDLSPLKTSLAAATPESFGYNVSLANHLLAQLNAVAGAAPCNVGGPSYGTFPYTLAECTPASFPLNPTTDPTTGNCAPDAAFPNTGDWARPPLAVGYCYSSLVQLRAGLVKVQGGKICATNTIASYTTTVDGIDTSLALLRQTAAVNAATLANVEQLLTPISNNIKIIYLRGNCGFVRSRINGVLENICDVSLDGIVKTNLALFATGAILALATAVAQTLAKRLRRFKSVLWADAETYAASQAADSIARKAKATAQSDGVEMRSPKAATAASAATTTRRVETRNPLDAVSIGGGGVLFGGFG